MSDYFFRPHSMEHLNYVECMEFFHIAPGSRKNGDMLDGHPFNEYLV